VTSNRTVLRYTLAERLIHWLAALTYIYLLLTGLAFYSPHLWWIAVMLGGGPTSRFWHPLVGLAFLLTVLWMWNAWKTDMRTTDADRRWGRAILHYIRNEDENLPPVGRFNIGQKQFFWIMLYSGLALLASGLVLWFSGALPWSLRGLRYLAVLVHVVAFLVTVAVFIVHVYMGTAVVRGDFTSVIRGEVSREWARAHHRLWLDRIEREDLSPK
jgi:formate dehydrogenase subunit gamma